MTGIWEFGFLLNYTVSCGMSKRLIENREHVWEKDYSLFDLIPNRFSLIFYSEYGAYADREYMLLKNNWSRIIEGTHCIFCGLGAILSFFSLIFYNKKYIQYPINKYYYIFCSSSMSAQAMNSILYMVNYFHQTKDIDNINYNSQYFPTGYLLNKRPFMYINILWSIMPLYVLFRVIYN